MTAAPKYIEGLGLRHSKPRPNPNADIARQKLSAEEGFIYSRVDGTTSYGEICSISGLGESRAAEILKRLKTIKLILGEGEPVPPKRDVAPPDEGKARGDATAAAMTAVADRKKAAAATAEEKQTASRSILAMLDDRSSVDPLLLAEAPSLDDGFKMRVLRVHKRRSKLNPYELLGLEPGADKKALKRGYFDASKEFHPDKFFGKEIGPYRQMLSDIFDQTKKGFEALMSMDDRKRAQLDVLLRKAKATSSSPDRRR